MFLAEPTSSTFTVVGAFVLPMLSMLFVSEVTADVSAEYVGALDKLLVNELDDTVGLVSLAVLVVLLYELT